MDMDLDRLQQQMQFISEIDRLKSVIRQNYLADGSRRENDTEHSWHLAMMVVVLSEYFKDADVLKTLKMVLIHDLVEIYAGDTFAYDEQGYLDKEDREQKAAEKIFSMLPSDQSTDLKELWQEFEEMDTQEAIFAAALDRIQPLMLNAASEGKMWKHHRVTAAKVLKRNEMVFERAPAIIAGYVRDKIAEASAKHYFHEEKPEE